ncbi:hypothetical protein K0M31_002461, partial [Melipona bicolor]
HGNIDRPAGQPARRPDWMVCSVCASYDSQRAFGADYAFQEDPSIHRYTSLLCNPRTRTRRDVTLRCADMPRWSAKIFIREGGEDMTRVARQVSHVVGNGIRRWLGLGSEELRFRDFRSFDSLAPRAVVDPCFVRSTRLDVDLDFGASVPSLEQLFAYFVSRKNNTVRIKLTIQPKRNSSFNSEKWNNTARKSANYRHRQTSSNIVRRIDYSTMERNSVVAKLAEDGEKSMKEITNYYIGGGSLRKIGLYWELRKGDPYLVAR